MSQPTAPRRVLLIAERFAPDLGGVARSAARTARAMARIGVETHVLAWTKMLQAGVLESDAIGDEGDGQVHVHRLGLFSNWDLSLQHTSNVLEWLHGGSPFDLIWGHYVFPAGFAAVHFAETNGLPSIISARGNDIDRLMFPPGDFARLMWTMQRASAVAAVSHDLAKKIDVLMGVQNHARVMHNVVDPHVFKPSSDEQRRELRARLEIAPEEAVLGFCGELRHKKGLPFLLSALNNVRRSRPACLLVIGAVRPREQAQLSAFAAEFPETSERILITGHIEEPQRVAAHLCICDLLLLPSVWDGLPNALLEAMACEQIVLASEAGGMREVVEHGENGILIPIAQLNRLAEGVLEALELPDQQRSALRQAARQRIVESFAPSAEEARIRDLLGSVM